MINLKKGERLNLSKAGLQNVQIKLNWDENKFDTGPKFDLDLSCFVCKNNSAGDAKLVSDNHFVFYNNTASPDRSVIHSGDNRTGAGSDDETVTANLAKLDGTSDEVSIIVTIDGSDSNGLTFGQVRGANIQVINADSGEVVAKFDLEDLFSNETAVQVGSLAKKDSGWSFVAVGAGFKKGLVDFVRIYGGSA